mgnify:CR=1 FL=1
MPVRNPDSGACWFQADTALTWVKMVPVSRVWQPSQVFSEKFKVKVRLSSSDPGIQMCVYRAETSSHQADCFFTNEVCPSSNYYEKGGSWGSEDGADFTVKVIRTASSTPTCTGYTVFMSNGR